jgi:hypothetical protein
MRYSELLTEMIWEDRFEAARVARNYPNAWIHFAGRPAYGSKDAPPIFKLGVNPQQGHHDPPGIYFYPVKFLFSDDASLSQYATEYKYYYIVSFKRSAKIVNLGRMTMPQAEAIATQNGWINELREVQANPALLQSNRQPMQRKLLRKPGGIFYATMDYLVNVTKSHRWLAMMRGIDGLVDPGYGIISGGEVQQAVIFARHNVQVLAQGENVDQGERQYAGILQQITEELGGRFYFKYKLPSADFDNDGRPFRIVLKLGNYKIETSCYKKGFWYTREHKYTAYSGTGDRDSEYRGIKYYVTRTAEEAEQPGKPMHWTGDRVNEVLYAIRPTTRFMQTVEDDGLHAWESIDSWGNIYAFLRAIVDRDDRLTVEASIEMLDRDDLAKVSLQFSRQSVEQVAKAVLDEMAQQLIANLPNAGKLKGRDFSGFNLGNRFDTV